MVDTELRNIPEHDAMFIPLPADLKTIHSDFAHSQHKAGNGHSNSSTTAIKLRLLNPFLNEFNPKLKDYKRNLTE